MSVEENKALIRHFLRELAEGNLDVIDELVAPDFVDHSLLPGQGSSREEFKRSAAEILSAFPVTSFVIEYQVAEGDMVVTRYVERAFHRGEFMGRPPTGKEETFTALYVHRIVGGKIAEEWSEANTLDVTLQHLEQETRERERIDQELRVARGIQQALLPTTLPNLEGWELARHYQPAREVGGDFYDFLRLADGQVGIIIGDASGKGVPAAVLMASTQSILRAVAQGTSAPGQVLAEANDVLCAYVPPNMFVTCFYGILEPSSGCLHYANAGHNLPCYRRGEGTDELRATGTPLGWLPNMDYEEKETTLVPGDSVLFYSDGLIEAYSPSREMFGTPRLRNLMTAHPTGGPSLAAFLLEELERFAGEGWEQEDDITLVTLRRSEFRARS
jgi:predicted ester cyclase